MVYTWVLTLSGPYIGTSRLKYIHMEPWGILHTEARRLLRHAQCHECSRTLNPKDGSPGIDTGLCSSFVTAIVFSLSLLLP